MSDTTIILLSLSIALIVGLISNRLIRFVHLPNVTGYLIVGILFGPFVLGLISPSLKNTLLNVVVSLGIIVDIALGFIAFSIGSEFKLKTIKKLGKGVITITLMQSCLALVFVDIILTVVTLITGNFNEYLPIILTLGAVATATAPAATLMVIKQYKAKGPVTEILLPVVAFDDAVGLILFSISFSIAQIFAKQYAGLEGGGISIINILLIPLLEIVLSLVIGFIIGFILSIAMKFFKSRANRLICMIAAVFLGVALCNLFSNLFGLELSSLLVCMMIGAVFCNLREDSLMILDGIERWTPAVFMLFFIISGAEIDFTVMANPIVLGICGLYILSRSLGKYFGARWGCVITKTDDNIKKYLGFTLLPQAGVAIGMARSASSTFRNLGNGVSSDYLIKIGGIITAVVLSATLIYELVGPIITKIALTKAGEIEPEIKKAKN